MGLLNGKDWSQKGFSCGEPEKAETFIDSNNTSECNLYYSTATYKQGTTHRTKAMINSVRELYADIDNEMHCIMNINSAKELISDIEPYFNKEVPEPTRITYTGHGLHIKWCLEDDLKMDTVVCDFLNKALQDKINELLLRTCYWPKYGYGVDKQCSDVGRMLRLENTYNAKEPTIALKTQIIYQSNNTISKETIKPYSLKVNGKTLLDMLNRGGTKKEKAKIYELNDILSETRELEPTATDKKEWNLKTANIWLKTNRNRLNDLETVQRLRNEANYNEGYRNTFIREYATILKCIEFDPKAFFETLLDINDWFNKPLDKKEVTAWAKTIWNSGKRTRQHKNETIVRVLDITEAERQELTTLIPRNEYLKRYYDLNGEAMRANIREHRAKAYAPIKEATGKKKQLRNKKIIKLKAEGLTIKEIAKKVGCSVRTVSYVLKQK